MELVGNDKIDYNKTVGTLQIGSNYKTLIKLSWMLVSFTPLIVETIYELGIQFD